MDRALHLPIISGVNTLVSTSKLLMGPFLFLNNVLERMYEVISDCPGVAFFL